MSEQALKDAYAAMQLASGFKVGDVVKVLRKGKHYEMGWNAEWNEGGMSDLVGLTSVIRDVNPNSGFQLSNRYWYPFFVLGVTKGAKTTTKVVLNDTYTAEVSEKEVKVGCQTFPYSVIKKIVAAHDKLVD